MNKKELEKLFDDVIIKSSAFCNPEIELSNAFNDDIKEFIFDTVIPVALKSVIPLEVNTTSWKTGRKKIKQLALDLYGIEL